jgi:hypothetical protein
VTDSAATAINLRQRACLAPNVEGNRADEFDVMMLPLCRTPLIPAASVLTGTCGAIGPAWQCANGQIQRGPSYRALIDKLWTPPYLSIAVPALPDEITLQSLQNCIISACPVVATAGSEGERDGCGARKD